jgi:DNA-directed RNA polymerase subunit E'/Rpb7
MRRLFRPVMEKIMELVAGQISQVDQAGLRVRVSSLLADMSSCAKAVQQILVSGGFARSPYLYKQIKDFARLQTWRIRVWREPNDNSAS